MTFAPAAANPRATAAPMPPVAPVRMTPRPSRPAPTLHVIAILLWHGPQRAGPSASAEHPLAAVAVDDLLDHLDPEPRPGRWVEPAVTVLDRLRHELVLHRIPERLHLDQLEGVGAEAECQAGRRDDGGRPAVGVGLAPVELDPLHRALEAGDALRAAGVDAHDVDGAGRQHAFEAVDVPFLLAIRDQARGFRTKVGVALGVPGAERLLDPVQAVLIERLDAPDRRHDVPFHVPTAVDHDHLIGPEALAHPADVLDVPVVLVPKPGVAPLPEADLEAMHAGRDPLLGLLHHPPDVFVMGMAGRHRWQLLVDGAAQQLDNRNAQELALDVPQRDVDRGHGVARDPTVVAVPPHLVSERVPDRDVVERILADHPLGHAFDDRFDREVRLGKLGDRLAPADNAIVGRDLDQAQVPQRIEVVGLRVADRDGLDGLDLAHGGGAPFSRCDE